MEMITYHDYLKMKNNNTKPPNEERIPAITDRIWNNLKKGSCTSFLLALYSPKPKIMALLKTIRHIPTNIIAILNKKFANIIIKRQFEYINLSSGNNNFCRCYQ